jgi:hypothetical protein
VCLTYYNILALPNLVKQGCSLAYYLSGVTFSVKLVNGKNISDITLWVTALMTFFVFRRCFHYLSLKFWKFERGKMLLKIFGNWLILFTNFASVELPKLWTHNMKVLAKDKNVVSAVTHKVMLINLILQMILYTPP